MANNSEPEFSLDGLDKPWAATHPAHQIRTSDLLIIGLVIIGWVYFLYMQFGASNAGNSWDGETAEGVAKAVSGFYLSLFAYFASGIGLLLLMAVRRYSWSTIGLNSVPQVALVGSVAGWLFYYLISNTFLSISAGTPGAEQALNSLGQVNDAIRETEVRTALFFAVVWLLKPAIQHIVFRGWLFSWARVRMKFMDAAVISSLVYAAVQVAVFDHFMEFSAVMAATIYAVYFFVSGIVLCLMTELTRSLWPGIVASAAVPLIFAFITVLGRL